MTPISFLTAWPLVMRAAADHVWQSTIVLILVGILAFVMRKNRAQIRYRLWMAASIKFLFPFAILTSLGSHLAMLSSHSVKETSAFYTSMEQVSQPFTGSAMPLNFSAEHHAAYLSFIHLLPMVLLAIWLCGVAAVLCLWYLRWRQIASAIQGAKVLQEGREIEALRRLEHKSGIQKPIQILVSDSSIEPGIFGVRRPVLIWPKGISERLNDAQLDAILAHEVWHVHRKDNLTAAIHMAVEAIFWFHPLVWWMGARLVEERERACDEEVLRYSSQSQTYAEGILNVCKFYTEAPLTCMSGVTGGNLKRRILRIMTQPFAHNLSISRKILLAGIGIAVIAGPIIFGLLRTPQAHASSSMSAEAPTPAFEVISIKPNHSGAGALHGWHYDAHDGNIKITNATTKSMIEWAYGLRTFQLSGGPDWSGSEGYDIEIQEKPLPASATKSPYGGEQGGHQVLQFLLANRFKLKLKEETTIMPVYALVQGPGGIKMSREEVPTGAKPLHYSAYTQDGKLDILGASSANLADNLAHQLNRVVVDKTGLKGFYGFTLAWTPHNNDSLVTAVHDQLGLQLKPETGPVPTYVIEHVERPVEK